MEGVVSIADRSITIAIEANVRGLTAGLRTAQQAATDFGSRLEKFAKDNEQNLDRVGKASMVMGGALLAGVGLAIKAASEFDSAMSEVQSSTHETAGNMDLLREAAINAGADTAFSAVEAAKGIDEMAKAGVSTKDILGGGLTGALSLAAAGSLDVGEAAEIAASSLTQFKLSGDKVPHIADLLAAGAGKAQGSVHDLGAALNQTGLVAASTGLTIEETTGGLAAFASAGLIGSDAGTSMKTMLQRLTPQSKEAAEKMAELGISAYDSQGNFKGLAAFAENLKTSMADLTPEARNAAMGIIFGSDAVRAANVLYEQGAAGISDWTDKVNDSGYAAVTAQIKTDNLAGDLERLGGSFDSVLIKGGSAAAQSLRGIVQGAEDLVDAIGNIPAPILNLAVGIAGIGGGALLLGGGLMTALPKVVEFRSSLSGLAEASPRAASALGKVGKAAGLAAAAMVGLEIFGAIAYDKHTQSTEQLANAILKLNKAASGDGISALDAALSDFGNFAGRRIAPDINSAADAIERITHPQGADGINRWADQAFGWAPLAKSETTQVDESLRKVGDELGNLAKNGGAEAAAASFRKLSDEFVKNGSSAQDALDHMPGYRDGLLDLAHQAGVTLEGQDLLDFALGKVPASMQGAAAATETYTNKAGEAKPMTEALAKQLEEVGLSAEGAIVDVDKFGQSLFNAGLLSLSASGASIAYQAAIDKITDSIKENGKSLDINTPKGRANQSAFNDLASSAIAAAEATAKQTLSTDGSKAAQDQLQGSLSQSYKDLITAAGQFDITGDAADTMARKALGIPKNVNIDAWIADHASQTLEGIKGKTDDLDGKQATITILTKHLDQYESIMGPTGKSAELFAAQNGGATGGRVFELAGGFAGGGKVPGGTPPNLNKDNILALVNGKPFGLQSDEWVINGRSSKEYDSELAAINAGTFPKFGQVYSPAPAPARQLAMAGATNVAAPDVRVFIGNEQIDARIEVVAGSVTDSKLGSLATTVGGRAR